MSDKFYPDIEINNTLTNMCSLFNQCKDDRVIRLLVFLIPAMLEIKYSENKVYTNEIGVKLWIASLLDININNNDNIDNVITQVENNNSVTAIISNVLNVLNGVDTTMNINNLKSLHDVVTSDKNVPSGNSNVWGLIENLYETNIFKLKQSSPNIQTPIVLTMNIFESSNKQILKIKQDKNKNITLENNDIWNVFFNFVTCTKSISVLGFKHVFALFLYLNYQMSELENKVIKNKYYLDIEIKSEPPQTIIVPEEFSNLYKYLELSDKSNKETRTANSIKISGFPKEIPIQLSDAANEFLQKVKSYGISYDKTIASTFTSLPKIFKGGNTKTYKTKKQRTIKLRKTNKNIP